MMNEGDDLTYFVLHDGKRYARHGFSRRNQGVLVFTNHAEARHFVNTIGRSLPQFQPVGVTMDKLKRIAKRNGNRICLRTGGELSVWSRK